jgi:UbiD family decarboxylase
MDLRGFVDLLRREGELAEVSAEVDPYLEIAEITDRASKAQGPALLFRSVKAARRGGAPRGRSDRSETPGRCGGQA